MAKLPEIPYEIKNQIYYTLCEFGCGRWKALLIYAESIAARSAMLSEDIRNERAEGVGLKAVQSLMDEDKRIGKIEFGDEEIIVPIGREDPSFTSIYAFDAFAALVHEVSEDNLVPELCYAGKTNTYPFHYIFAASKQEILYRVIIYGPDAFSRIGFLNNTYDKSRDNRFVTMLVVSDTYSWEDFVDIYIRGKTRIAFITKANRKNRTHRCMLTDIIEEE